MRGTDKQVLLGLLCGVFKVRRERRGPLGILDTRQQLGTRGMWYQPQFIKGAKDTEHSKGMVIKCTH